MSLFIARINYDNITTVTRDALAAADAPKGTVIFNVTTNQLEVNTGTGAAPIWESATDETLAQVLLNGNTSGASDILMADTQKIQLGNAGNEAVGNGNDVTLKAAGVLNLGFSGSILELCELAGQYFMRPDVSLINLQTTLLNTRTTLNIQGNAAMNARLQLTRGDDAGGFTQFEQAAANLQLNFGASMTLYIVNGSKQNVDTAIRGQTDNNAFYLDASADSVGIGKSNPAEKLDVNGNAKADNLIGVSKLSYNVLTKTNADSPYLTDDGEVVLADATAGNIIVDLPAAASNSGAQINVKKIDASVNTVTIDGNLAETIDGSLTKIISVQYESLTLVCNGSNWFII